MTIAEKEPAEELSRLRPFLKSLEGVISEEKLSRLRILLTNAEHVDDALARLAKEQPELAAKLAQHELAANFRNRLFHQLELLIGDLEVEAAEREFARDLKLFSERLMTSIEGQLNTARLGLLEPYRALLKLIRESELEERGKVLASELNEGMKVLAALERLLKQERAALAEKMGVKIS